MTEPRTLTLAEIETLSQRALEAHGASPEGARSIARAIALAEASGNAICGMHYVHKICDQLEAGAVDGRVKPVVVKTGQPARLVVDVRHGFAHRAFDLRLPDLVEAAEKYGVATLALKHSYNALDLGQFAERIAEAGMIGIAFSSSPAAVAHPGMSKKLFGTNPFAYAVPGTDGEPELVVDMSTSAVTKNAIVLKAAAGETLEPGVAVDRAGQPTTDPKIALEDGAILAFGGHKGAAISLLVELLGAVLTGSSLSKDAGMFVGKSGKRPDIGQFFIALDPGGAAGEGFDVRLGALGRAIAEAGGRLPGERRFEKRTQAEKTGVQVKAEIVAEVEALGGGPH
ncbi:MAG: Ldh family oxidoreductase [Hyphomicrobiaceae bacterium]